eukprot:PhM_4_TR16478/c2_g1_i1/m.11167
MFSCNIWSVLFLSTIESTDNFTEVFRKLLCAGFFLVVGPIGFQSIIALNGTLSGSATVAEGTVTFIAGIIFVIVATASWVHLKRSNNVSRTLLTLTLFVLYANDVCLQLLNPGLDTNIMVFCVFISSMFMDLHVPFFLGCVVLAFMINVYNYVFGRESGSYIAIQEGVNSFEDRLVNQIAFVSVYVILTVLIHRLLVECNAFLHRIQRGLEITQSLGEALLSYDTEKARESLMEYQKDAHHDAELSAMFSQMIDNLEGYRPFLPNFLLMKDSSDGDGDGGNKNTTAAHDNGHLTSSHINNNNDDDDGSQVSGSPTTSQYVQSGDSSCGLFNIAAGSSCGMVNVTDNPLVMSDVTDADNNNTIIPTTTTTTT